MTSLKYKKRRAEDKRSGEKMGERLQLSSKDDLKKCHSWSERVEERIHIKEVSHISDGVRVS